MKYLKVFNENNTVKEVEEFCKDHLSYLLDENSNLEVIINTIGDYKFTLKTPISTIDYFYWKDIKDEFIPFLEMFNKRYIILNGSNDDNEIPEVSFYTISNKFKPIIYSLDDVLSNNGIIRIGLKSIKFYFKTK